MAETKEIDAKTVETPEIVVEDTPKKAIAADEGIETLKQQLAEEKRLREEAQRTAREAAARAHVATNERDDTNFQLVTNAIEQVKANSAQLKAAYANAMQNGQFDKAADLQLEMSSNAAKLLQLETGKQAMAERPKTPPPAVDPVEDLCSRLTPESAAWVRAHPECATDPKMFRKMIRAHEDAVDDGIKSDTPEYFEAVERRLGFNKRSEPETDEDGTELAARQVSRRSSPAAAPVSRSAPSSNGSTPPRAVRLTAEEAEMARLNKMTPQEYYEQKQRIKHDQRYN